MSKPPTWKDVQAAGAGRRNNFVPRAIHQSRTGTWRVTRPIVDPEKCTKCGICVTFCPDSVMKMGDVAVIIDYDYCKGCGICVNECSFTAIVMEREKY